MPFQPGTRLGPYEILSALGAGGMGEVYRARDPKLKRDVAVKVLLDLVASDPDRLARFHREAEVLAALNHPNIAHIYGFENSNATHALVMELVEGPTLADRIVRGPIPIAEALSIARQIAEALEAAHEQGIVHRDLKPANVKIREDGTVKVLDFGLAKMLEPVSADGGGPRPDLTAALTIESPAMTMAGVILGTAAYMAPEQAKGRAVDRRADVWAFGCVLYEMLTGHRAFGGDTVTEALATVLERDPDWTKLPAATPSNVLTALRRTLQKDPRRRLHDIADVRIELEGDLPDPAITTNGENARSSLRRPSVLVATTIIVSLAAGLAGWYFKSSPPAPAAPVTRMVFAPEALVPADSEGAIALSPDGRRLAYVVASGGRRQLYLRGLDQFEGRPIPGTVGADNPAFSPDGRWLAFGTQSEIKKVEVAGGTPVSLCEAAGSRGLSWESQDAIVFNAGRSGGIWRVAAAGGMPIALTRLAVGELEHQSPYVLPGGKALLYTSLSGAGVGIPQVVVQSLATGVRRVIGAGGGARYLATGHVVYVRDGNLFAVPFDLARLEPRGTPMVVLQGIRQTAAETPQLAYSVSGAIAYVPAAAGDNQDVLVWVDAGGVEQPTAVSGPDFSMPRVAPKSPRAVIVSQGDLWLYDLTLGRRTRLTADATSTFPIWSPTGAELTYRSQRSGRYEIYTRTVDGSVPEELFPTEQDANIPLSWSPDGQILAAVSVNNTTRNDIWVYDRAHRPGARPFARTTFREGAPTFSPDGRWIAYVSDQSGRNEVYMRPFPGPGEELPISTDGGSEPAWARSGGPLFYRQGDAMMAVDITTSPTADVGKPRRLFEKPYKRGNGFWPDYDVAPDGQRLLMVKSSTTEASSRINVVLNWQEELKRLVPTR